MKVLVPLDGSVRAEEALRTADRLLRNEVGGVLYLHRVCISPVVESKETAASGLKKVEVYLRTVAAHLKEKSYHVQTYVDQASGDPAPVIAAKAEALGTDVIIMCSHGKSALQQFLLGSTAYNLSRMSKISVLIVKQTSEREDLDQGGG